MAPAFCNRCGDALEGCDPRDELIELDVLLERLILKRQDLKRKINRFHSPIVRHLPPDVMSTIFEFCLPDFTDHQLPSMLPAPLSLGAICSYWRDIAWSTPTLWSSLVVRDPPRSYSRTITVITREWLARSGRLPLSIRILSTFYNKTVAALIYLINQYSNRWSDLDLDMPYNYYQHFHTTDNHAPILKSIRFHLSGLRANPVGRKLNFQLYCPRLERATILYFPLDGTNIQWDNLTHLTLHSMSIIDSFFILRKTPRLVFCKVVGVCSPHGLDEQNKRIPDHTSLRFLHLSVNSSAAEDFLDNLTAPNLEEFSLPSCYISRIKVITSFLRRSACSLRSLSMIFSIFPQYHESFMSLLQSMPSLTTLSISSLTTLWNTIPEEYDPQNITQLVAKVLSSQSTPTQQGFLPNLSVLEYTGELYLHPGNYDDLYSLPPADSAVHGPFHLLNLDLYTTTRIPKNMISYVSSLVDRGITVNILSDSKDILQSSIDYYTYKKDSLCQDWFDNFDSTLLS